MSEYRIVQRPCPDCGHTQLDRVVSPAAARALDAIERSCDCCGTVYAKDIKHRQNDNE